MTNTRITDAEIFERRYPVLLREFSLRKGSGGKGQHPGGDGVVRDIEFRIPVQVSILSERRVYRPYGLQGGEDAQCGLNIWVREVQGGGSADTDAAKRKDDKQYLRVNLGGKNSASMKTGERIIIMTPGGGGWGKVGQDSSVTLREDPKLAWARGSISARTETSNTSV